MFKQFLVIVGAILVIEGLPYLASPTWMKKMMEQVRLLPDPWLRIAGLAAVATGMLMVWLAGHMG